MQDNSAENLSTFAGLTNWICKHGFQHSTNDMTCRGHKAARKPRKGEEENVEML